MSPWPKQCTTSTLNPHWGRAATGNKKVLYLCTRDHLFATLWPVASQPSLPVGLSRQENWSGLPYPSRALYFLTLLEHYISCCPSCQPPWVLGAARAPGSYPTSYTTSTPGPHRADPGPPGQTQEQTPHAKVEIKPQLKPRGSVAKEEDPNPSHQPYKLQIRSTRSTRQTLCLGNIHKRTLSSHERKRTSSDSCELWRQEHTGVGAD